MSYISESQLSGYRPTKKMFSTESAQGLAGYRDSSKPIIFLSHKHDEHSIMQDVIAFLKKEGVDVYVDWLDESMPAYTNSETAIRLKQKIRTADKFILVATSNAINSKWCNWELGLGDAAKYIEHIALLPINRTYESFNGAEYLKIYPSIEYRDGTTRTVNGVIIPKGYYVLYPSINDQRTIISLKDWLKNH